MGYMMSPWLEAWRRRRRAIRIEQIARLLSQGRWREAARRCHRWLSIAERDYGDVDGLGVGLQRCLQRHGRSFRDQMTLWAVQAWVQGGRPDRALCLYLSLLGFSKRHLIYPKELVTALHCLRTGRSVLAILNGFVCLLVFNHRSGAALAILEIALSVTPTDYQDLDLLVTKLEILPDLGELKLRRDIVTIWVNLLGGKKRFSDCVAVYEALWRALETKELWTRGDTACRVFQTQELVFAWSHLTKLADRSFFLTPYVLGLAALGRYSVALLVVEEVMDGRADQHRTLQCWREVFDQATFVSLVTAWMEALYHENRSADALRLKHAASQV